MMCKRMFLKESQEAEILGGVAAGGVCRERKEINRDAGT